LKIEVKFHQNSHRNISHGPAKAKNNNKIKVMIRKLKSGEYRLYSRKKDPKTDKRRNLGTFKTLTAAKKHEREIQYFEQH